MEAAKTVAVGSTQSPAAAHGDSVLSKSPPASLFIQKKLTIGSPDDIYEKEADAMADKVMRTEISGPINFAGGKNNVQRKCEHCEEEEKLQRKESGNNSTGMAPPIVHEVLNAGGTTLNTDTRSFMESRFNYDFTNVKIHDNNLAAKSAGAINALAYTSGNNIVFNSGQYNTTCDSGKKLLAHELTHVVQQSSAIQQSPIVRRAPCTPSSICGGGPVPGSAQEADISGTSQEVGPRERRKKMTPARAIATGHGGRALQLEKFFEAQAPGKLANLQGIFVDQDIAREFDATTTSCSGWVTDSLPPGSPTPPRMVGATKLCTFVHDFLNQQALAFNTTTAAIIGGKPRERWRAETLEILIHESEHPRYEAATSANPVPSGVTSPTCQRGNILQELSEMAAILSEFPTAIRAANAETNSTGPLHKSLDKWFDNSIQNGGENIKSALEQMGCSCSCPEVNAFVIETFNFESGSWTVAEKDAFHREIRKAKYGISWPLAPSSP